MAANENWFNNNVEYTKYADLPLERVIEGAINKIKELESIIVIGRQKDGELYISGTHARMADVIYDLERAKLRIL